MVQIQRINLPERRSGKTTKLLNLADQFIQDGYNVLFVASTMSHANDIRRIRSRNGYINEKTIIVGPSLGFIRGVTTSVCIVDNTEETTEEFLISLKRQTKHLFISNTEVELLDTSDPWLYFLAYTQFHMDS